MAQNFDRTNVPFDTNCDESKTLRQRAEAIARKSRTGIEDMAPEDIQALVHKLEVHQIELQLQNEELIQTQVDLANARDCYAERYEFAPVGCVVLDKNGTVLEANAAAATLLGIDRRDLTHSMLTEFVASEAQDDFHAHLLAAADTDDRQIWELPMHKADGFPLMIRFETVRQHGKPGGDESYHTALIDMTAQREAESDLRDSNRELDKRIHNRTTELMQSIGDLQAEVDRRRKLEERLRHEVEITTALIETTQAIVLLLDHEGKIVQFNEFMEKLTGYAQEDVIGKDWFETFLPRDDRHKIRDLFKQAIMGERTEGNINPILTKDGDLRQIQWYDAQLTKPDGHLAGLLCTGHDITERMRMEESLRISEERLALAVTVGGIGVFEHDHLADTVHLSAELAAIHGWDASEPRVAASEFFETIHPEDRDKMSEARRHCHDPAGDGRMAETLRITRQDGAIRWLNVCAETFFEGDGANRQPVRTIGTVHDITSDVQTKEALHEREARLSAVLNTAHDAIITIDYRGLITGVNTATEKMFGYSEEEMLERNVSMLMPSPYREEHDQYLANFMKTGEARIIGTGRELVGQHKDGSIIPIDLAVSQVDHLGEFTGIIRDISNRKNLERHLAEVRADEQRNIAQELHDGIGGQMTGVGMLAATLAKKLERERSAHADSAAELLQHIRTAHDQLREVSRGLMPVQQVSGGLEAALLSLAEKYNNESFECVFERTGDFAMDDSISANHLYRIAQEAISNAIRHGQATCISIRLEMANDRAKLIIEDNGSGFQEIPDSGDGMGLRTMKYRAGLMNATVHIRPRSRGGTVVECSFPNRPTTS